MSKQIRFRQLHRAIAPIMILPVVNSLVTGSLYQIADLTGKGEEFKWLLEMHVGHFGIINLESIYVFLNGAGVLALAVTGISMWLQSRRRSIKRAD